MRVELDGLEPRPGDADPVFAFFVVQLVEPVDRDGLLDVLRAVAPLIPDVESFIGEFPEQLDGELQLIAIPWIVPDDATAVREQTEVVDSASAVGVVAAWFFQTGEQPTLLDEVEFPLDDVPLPDPNDLGLSIKLAGDEMPGENTVLLAFHTLWLAPYSGRYRDTAIAIDRDHRAVQLWTERLDAPDAIAHLTWIAAMLDRVLPIVHARFGVRGDDAFVLGGNPLRGLYADGGELAIDTWLADQTEWGDDEVARMLCELADDIAAGTAMEPRNVAPVPVDNDRHGIARYAGDLLIARARLNRLDPRALPALLPAASRRPEVSELAAVIGDRRAVPELALALASPAAAAAARALGALGDPAAAPVLATVMASDAHDQTARIAAARALAFGPLASTRSSPQRAEAARAVAALADDKLADAAARALTGNDAVELAPLLHTALTSVALDHDSTCDQLRAALDIATAFPDRVRAVDLAWITRFAEPELRAAAHAVLAAIGSPSPYAPIFDAAASHELDDIALIRALADPHVVGRAALIDEAGMRSLAGARRPIVGACSDVIARARPGTARLLHHDARVIESGVAALRDERDDEVIALFDRMLRNANVHVKWELMQDPPIDARLIGGMFHVAGERWGWQELAAKRWLSRFSSHDTYKVAYAAEHARQVDIEDTN
jgi:hypothetical protein